MEPTQLGLVIAGSVIALTIAAVAAKQSNQSKRERTYKRLSDEYTLQREDGTGTDVYDPFEKMWHFVPNKGGKSRRKKI